MKKKSIGIKLVKVLLCIFCIFALLFSNGCGLSDWGYDMQNGYAIWRINSRQIECGKIDGPNSIDPVVEDYVVRFSYNSEYIFLQCVEVDVKNVDEEINKDNPMYYLIDVKTDEVKGPLTKSEFIVTTIDIVGTQDELSWIETDPKPEGAE
ncbi:MAG: hypothetical protein E7566_07950 [Ruminococcaceae bacterium]|nr:hypothetical protein [Oscillospiraceae bacterium]